MKYKINGIALLILLIFGLTIPISAQRNQGSFPTDTLSRGQKNRPLLNELDTANFQYFTLRNIHEFKEVEKASLSRYFQQYDPARSRDFDYGHLGNMGSAAYPFVLDPKPRKGLILGLDQYRLYQKSEDDIKFYSKKSPYSSLYFSGGETQQDLRAAALLTRSFQNGFSWVVDYNRIAQEGVYQHQNVKQTTFSNGFSYMPDSSKYAIFLNYMINVSSEEINGGILDGVDFSDPNLGLRVNIPTEITDAETRLQDQFIQLNAFYGLNSAFLDNSTSDLIRLKLEYQSQFFRYSDQSIASDSTYYGNFYSDSRGIRHFIENRRFRTSMDYIKKVGENFRFTGGANYDINFLNQSIESEIISELYANGSIEINPFKKLSIKADGFIGLLNATGVFGLNSIARYNIAQDHFLNFQFLLRRQNPFVLYEQLVINESNFWLNDFDKSLTQNLHLFYENNKYRLNLGYRLINSFNHFYFDQDARIQQYDPIFSINHLYLKKDFRFKFILLENLVFYQIQNEDLHPLPEIFTKNSLSFYGKIFQQKMLLKAGFDFRMMLFSSLPSYNPVIGQFHLSPEEDSIYEPYPLLDFHASFKISSFTAFLKYENLGGFLFDNPEFLVNAYPQFDNRFRFGIKWNLWN